MTALPPARHDGATTYSLAVVCLGNICRSPMAQVVLASRLDDAGLAGRVVVDSAGTGDWHLDDVMDERAAATLVGAGYDPSAHRSRLFEGDWFGNHDAILVMDEQNRRDVLRLAPTPDDRERVLMFRAFDPAADGDLEVPDPWYGGQAGFDEVLAIVERTAAALVTAVAAEVTAA